MKWQDLEPGMVVELANGWRDIVCRQEVDAPVQFTKCGLMLRHTDDDEGTWFMYRDPAPMVNKYDDDMVHSNEGRTIKKVYRCISNVLDPRYSNLTLIWEREKRREITIEVSEEDIEWCRDRVYSSRTEKVIQRMIDAWDKEEQ